MSTVTDSSSSDEDEREALQVEHDALDRLSAYALAIPADRIPLHIVDPILGVQRTPPE